MKKYVTGLLALLLIVCLGLSGCGASGQNDSKGSQALDNAAQKNAADRSSAESPKQEKQQESTDKGGKNQSKDTGNGPAKDNRKATDEVKLPTVIVKHPSDSEKEITDLLQHMTLEEKIGQLVMIGMDGTKVGSRLKTILQDYDPGGVILYGENIKSPGQTVKLINQLKAVNADTGNPLPLFVSVDQEGGRVERMPDDIKSLPSNGAVGKINDPHFSYQIGQLIGTELKDFGFNMDFAPVLDIIDHPGHSVIGDRSFGSDKKTVSQLGIATMKGIQSRKVISVVKHFPGYGAVTVNAHKDLPAVDYGLQRLESKDWFPYKKAIANGADIVMVTHIMLSKLDPHHPASFSHKIISGMLRDKLGFDGVVITDDMTMGAIAKHYDIDQAAVQAVLAGADIVLVSFNPGEEISVLKALKHAVEDGKISKERLNESVRRIARLKQKYHLSDQRAGKIDVQQLNDEIQSVLNRKGH